tara:strand:- start:214 stop:672 length:459 start_codon:yes stop_codon:yes gene_type:complete
MVSIQLDNIIIFYGIISGLFATIIMTLIQIIAWTKLHTEGILEWHENVKLLSKINKKTNYSTQYSFIFHFIHGSLGGIGFAIVLETLNLQQYSLIIGLIGGLLFMGIILKIHKKITDLDPIRHPLGYKPFLVSLISHIIYGLTLGYFYSIII